MSPVTGRQETNLQYLCCLGAIATGSEIGRGLV